MKRPMVYLAIWLDRTYVFRVAGAYRTERAAWNRVRRLGYGSVQAVRLGGKVLMAGEKRRQG